MAHANQPPSINHVRTVKLDLREELRIDTDLSTVKLNHYDHLSNTYVAKLGIEWDNVITSVEDAKVILGRTNVTNRMIDDAVDQDANVLRIEHLDRLNEFQQLLYGIVEERERISPGDLYEVYCEHAVEPKTKRTIRSHLTKMVQYQILVKRGTSQQKRYLVR